MNLNHLKIDELNKEAMALARSRQDSLAKPPHSLGVLEDISVRMAGITGKLYTPVDKRRVLIFAADNGIVEEGVSGCPQSVTLSQTINFTRGITGVAVLAEHFRTELDVIDVGINAEADCPGIRNEKIAMGTRNFAKEPAMSEEECIRAMEVGIRAAERAKSDGVDILGIGEMGIGNTTTSSAVLSAILGLPAEETTSRGAGINDEAYRKKIRVIDEAIQRYFPEEAIRPQDSSVASLPQNDTLKELPQNDTLKELTQNDSLENLSRNDTLKELPQNDSLDSRNDILHILSCVGGFDIAAMCGAFLGAAALRIPVVIDGFISAVAALAAYRIDPLAKEYMFSSHASRESGYQLAMNALGLAPMLLLSMRLGEGSGCPMAFEIISAAEDVIKNMATFEEAAINDDYLEGIRGNRKFLGEI